VALSAGWSWSHCKGFLRLFPISFATATTHHWVNLEIRAQGKTAFAIADFITENH
jgi:hypothetical protein